LSFPLPLLEEALFFDFPAHFLFLQQALAFEIELALHVAIPFGFALFEAAGFRLLIAPRAHPATEHGAADRRRRPSPATSEHGPRRATDDGAADPPANFVACLGQRRFYRRPRNQDAREQDTGDQPAAYV
jgi:hypothetical protein